MSSGAFGESTACWRLHLDSGLQTYDRISFCCFEPPSLWPFIPGVLAVHAAACSVRLPLNTFEASVFLNPHTASFSSRLSFRPPGSLLIASLPSALLPSSQLPTSARQQEELPKTQTKDGHSPSWNLPSGAGNPTIRMIQDIQSSKLGFPPPSPSFPLSLLSAKTNTLNAPFSSQDRPPAFSPLNVRGFYMLFHVRPPALSDREISFQTLIKCQLLCKNFIELFFPPANPSGTKLSPLVSLVSAACVWVTVPATPGHTPLWIVHFLLGLWAPLGPDPSSYDSSLYSRTLPWTLTHTRNSVEKWMGGWRHGCGRNAQTG